MKKWIILMSMIAILGLYHYTIGGPLQLPPLPYQTTDCSTYIWEGALCWDTDNDILYIGTGAAATAIGSGAGDVAIDAIWNAKGDIAVGTGVDTAGILAIGTAYQILHVNTDTPGWTSTLGATGTRLTKGWFTNLEITNYPTVNGVAVFDQDVSADGNPSFSTINVVGTNSLNLGTAGSLVGQATFKNLTSGGIIVQAVPGALGTPTVSIPAQTGTILVSNTSTTAGKIFQSTTSAGLGALSTSTYPSTAAGTGTILRANGTNWVATTSTFADTYGAGTVLYAGSANTVSGLAIGTAGQILKVNAGATAPEWSSTLNLSKMDMTAADYSIPWVVSVTVPTTFTTNGMAWYDSDAFKLMVRDSTTGRNLAFVPEGIAYGGGTILAANATTVGGISYASGKHQFYGLLSEDLYILPGSQTNEATIGTNTGITNLKFGALNLMTTGMARMGIEPVKITTSTYTIPTTLAYGTLFYTSAGESVTITGPTWTSGMSYGIKARDAFAFILDFPNTLQQFMYLSSTGGAGKKITSAATKGSFATFHYAESGYVDVWGTNGTLTIEQ